MDVEDRQLECAKDGTDFPKKNTKRNSLNTRQKTRRIEVGKELEYHSSLGSPHFRFLLFNILWCNHLHREYRLLGRATMGHNDHGNRCSWHRFLDGHHQVAIASDQEVESKPKEGKGRNELICQNDVPKSG